MTPPAKRLYWAARQLIGKRHFLFFRANPHALAANAPPACQVLEDYGIEILQGFAEARHQPLSDYTWRLPSKHLLICARNSAGQVVAWGWLTIGRDSGSEVPFEWTMTMSVPPGWAYLWDFFTLPASRGQRLYPALLQCAARYCQARGIANVAIYCARENEASRKGLMAAGFGGEAPVSISRIGPIYGVTAASGHEILVTGPCRLDRLFGRQVMQG